MLTAADVPVLSGTGTLEGQATATSDASGIARFTDLGIHGTGDNTLQFATGAIMARFHGE